MSKIFSILMVLVAMSATPTRLQSQETAATIVNPCERGPVPNLKVINHARQKFALQLIAIRPDIPFGVASRIAYQVCDDLGMLYDSPALSRRTNELIREAGY